MAEAAVEDRPSQKFYYCHVCNIRFEAASNNFTCPHCSDGFVEELQEGPEYNPNGDEAVDVDDWEDDEMDIHDLFMASLPVMEERRSGRSRHPDGNRSSRRTLTRLASSNLRQNVPFENLIQDFIINLGVGLNWGGPGNMQLFLGNPGDYAWGREGLDAIVTQLLNQMDSTGPPPVPQEVIDALPIVEISVEQVESKLQCSICWEDFVLDESVRQLPCTHVYHESCIRPWLKLHGTCPICRQNLVTDEHNNSDNNQDTDGGPSGGGNSSSALHASLRNLFQPAHISSSNASSSSSSSLDNNSGPSRSRSTDNTDFMM